MMDLIDRGAAIDAIKDLCEECDADYCGECRIDYPVKDAKSVLETLPPAQLCTNLTEVGADCISREKAIDAINNYFGFNIEEEYGSAVQEVINSLPSAQPEIVRCKDCLKRNAMGYCTKFQNNIHGIATSWYKPNDDDFCSRAERREE